MSALWCQRLRHPSVFFVCLFWQIIFCLASSSNPHPLPYPSACLPNIQSHKGKKNAPKILQTSALLQSRRKTWPSEHKSSLPQKRCFCFETTDWSSLEDEERKQALESEMGEVVKLQKADSQNSRRRRTLETRRHWDRKQPSIRKRSKVCMEKILLELKTRFSFLLQLDHQTCVFEFSGRHSFLMFNCYLTSE